MANTLETLDEFEQWLSEGGARSLTAQELAIFLTRPLAKLLTREHATAFLKEKIGFTRFVKKPKTKAIYADNKRVGHLLPGDSLIFMVACREGLPVICSAHLRFINQISSNDVFHAVWQAVGRGFDFKTKDGQSLLDLADTTLDVEPIHRMMTGNFFCMDDDEEEMEGEM